MGGVSSEKQGKPRRVLAAENQASAGSAIEGELLPARARGGRPRLPFDQEVADRFCDLVSSDRHSIDEICAMEGMRSRMTMYRWLDRYPEFREAYARACKQRSHSAVDRIVECENRLLLGEYDPATARTFIDSAKWRAAKLNAAYGDRIHIDAEVKSEAQVVHSLGALSQLPAERLSQLQLMLDSDSDSEEASKPDE